MMLCYLLELQLICEESVEQWCNDVSVKQFLTRAFDLEKHQHSGSQLH